MAKPKYRCGMWRREGDTHRMACVNPRGSCKATVKFMPVAGHFVVEVRKSGTKPNKAYPWDVSRSPRVKVVGAIHVGDAKFDAERLLAKCQRKIKPHYDFAGAKHKR